MILPPPVDDRPPFQRLEDRLAGRLRNTALQLGVPEHLETALRDWLDTALRERAGRRTASGWRYNAEICQAAALRLGAPARATPGNRSGIRSYVNTILYAPREQLHEVVDAVLYSWPPYRNGPPLGNLNAIFGHAGSAYRVGDDGRQLVLRVDPTVEAAFQATAEGADPQAGEYLRRAWQHAYGLTPDPTAAYRDAVRAVEEAFVPVVSPNNSRATLGTVCRDLANQNAQWELGLVDERDAAGDISYLVGMLEQLWRGQRSRHGGGSTSRDQTQAEAEAAVHLAALAVQWLSTGVLRLKP